MAVEGAAQPPLPPEPASAPQTLTASCTTCGSTVAFVPGTRSLRCTSCQAVQPIGPGEDTVIEEHSYDDWLAPTRASR